MSADALLHSALAALEEGALLLNAAGEIEFANEPLRSWFGLTNEIVGRTPRAIFFDGALVELAETAKAEAIQLPAERAGQSRWLEARAHRLTNAEKTRTLLLFRDLTAQRSLEEAGAEVVANVSHELRTPVSILAGYIENLVDFPKMPRAEQVEICGIMQEHAERLKALLDDLLTLAFFDAQSEVLDFAPLDLGDFLRRLAKDWQPVLAGKGMAFIIELEEGAETIVVDRFRFEQVMHNLIDNAFKYTPIEGQIRVRGAAVGEQIEISVEDNGAGIPQDDLPHIFERFYRVDKARSRKYGGTGLGLSIVKQIVALHGGTVRAESVLQMSTRVTISLPRERPGLRSVLQT